MLFYTSMMDTRAVPNRPIVSHWGPPCDICQYRNSNFTAVKENTASFIFYLSFRESPIDWLARLCPCSVVESCTLGICYWIQVKCAILMQLWTVLYRRYPKETWVFTMVKWYSRIFDIKKTCCWYKIWSHVYNYSKNWSCDAIRY